MASALQSVKDLFTIRDPLLRNRVIDFGLLPGHRDYTRFFIIGRSRTGSNFLRGILNSHPNVVTFGELFQTRKKISWGFADYSQPDRLFQTFLDEPVRFLQEQVYRKQPRHVRAVGFKIFYYHAQAEPWQPLWDYLLAEKDIHILHIKRRNMLRTHLSRARADRSGSWTNTTGQREEEQPIELNYSDLVDDFATTLDYERTFDQRFQNHPLLEIFYEDLAADWRAGFERIQQFLCLPPAPASPQTFKQSHESLSAAISNFSELKARFAGSEWAPFFEED